MTIDSLDAFRRLLQDLPGPDEAARAAARDRQARLTKPTGALARLEDIAIGLAGWQGRNPPALDKPLALVFAGNHGVAARGVSAYPAEVTVQMVANFQAGGAAINQLCKTFGADLKVLDLDLDRPTADFTQDAAMTEAECAAALDVGWSAVASDADVLMVGEMGIGNTTSAAALCAATMGGTGADWAGPGTGVDGDGVGLKARVIDEGLELHQGALSDPLEALRRLGGREIAALCGAVASARHKNIPVLLDGFVVGAAAAVLEKARSGALDHCLAAHVSAEPGHRKLLDSLGLDPLLSLGMRLGEASGAALALAVLQGAVATHAGMATFDEAGVSDKD